MKEDERKRDILAVQKKQKYAKNLCITKEETESSQ
jgi:hypothetical protein